MALSANRDYRTRGITRMIRVKMTTNDIYYKGAIINITAAGGLGIVAGDVANQGSTSGVVAEYLDNTGKTEYANVEVGVIFVPLATAAQADVGDYVYATDDGTVSKTGANSDPIGKIEDVDVGVGLWINFDKGIVKTALV